MTTIAIQPCSRMRGLDAGDAVETNLQLILPMRSRSSGRRRLTDSRCGHDQDTRSIVHLTDRTSRVAAIGFQARRAKSPGPCARAVIGTIRDAAAVITEHRRGRSIQLRLSLLRQDRDDDYLAPPEGS